MNNKPLLPLLAGALAIAVTASQSAYAVTCSFPAGTSAQPVTYWSEGASFDHTDERCDDPGACKLQGWMVVPKAGADSSGKHKTIVWEHGSPGLVSSPFDEQRLDDECFEVRPFLVAGFAVFMPFRRGVFDTTTVAMVGTPPPADQKNRFDGDPGGYFTNTGWAAYDWADAMMGTTGDPSKRVGDGWNGYLLYYMQDEVSIDLDSALTALTDTSKNPWASVIDLNHIGIAGESYGGAFAAIASGNKFTSIQPTAFVSMSGAALSWHNSHWWPDVLESYTAEHTAPIFFQRVLKEDPATPPTFDSALDQASAALSGSGHGGVLVWHYSLDIPACDGVTPLADLADCYHSKFIVDNFMDPSVWSAHLITWLDTNL